MSAESKNKNSRGLSFPVIILSGAIIAFFILIAVVVTKHLLVDWSPTKKNVEQLLSKRKYKEALSLINQKNISFKDSSEQYVMEGIVWMALAWERENREHWHNYGKDENDWFNSSEAQLAYSKLKNALRINYKNADAHYYMALLFMEKGWYYRAESEFIELLKLRKKELQVRINLGVLYSKMNRYKMSEKQFLKAYKLAPKDPSVAKNLAFLYRAYMNRPKDAIYWGNKYLNMFPKNDYDVNIMKREMNILLERYPEFAPKDSMLWKKTSKFKKRKHFIKK